MESLKFFLVHECIAQGVGSDLYILPVWIDCIHIVKFIRPPGLLYSWLEDAFRTFLVKAHTASVCSPTSSRVSSIAFLGPSAPPSKLSRSWPYGPAYRGRKCQDGRSIEGCTRLRSCYGIVSTTRRELDQDNSRPIQYHEIHFLAHELAAPTTRHLRKSAQTISITTYPKTSAWTPYR